MKKLLAITLLAIGMSVTAHAQLVPQDGIDGMDMNGDIINENVPDYKVAIDPVGYGHINTPTFLYFAQALLEIQKTKPWRFQIPPSSFLGFAPACIQRNGCIEVAAFIVQYYPVEARKWLKVAYK